MKSAVTSLSQQRRVIFVDLCVLAVLLSALFFLNLGGHPLIPLDETRYVSIAWRMFKMHSYWVPMQLGSPFLGKPILYYWLEILAFHWFGVSEFAARFFPALLSLLTCLYSYFVLNRVVSRRAGWLAALLMATAPLFFLLSHYANMDVELASWLTGVVLSFLAGIHRLRTIGSVGYWIYIGTILSACAFLTKGLVGVVFPAMVLGVWILLYREWSLLRWRLLWRCAVIFLLIVVPWLWKVESIYPGFLNYFFIHNQFTRYVSEHFNSHASWYYYLPILLFGLLPYSLYVCQAVYSYVKNICQQERWLLTFLWLWVVLVTFFFSMSPSKLLGYITPVIPILAIVLALYCDALWGEPVKGKRCWMPAVLIVLSAVCIAVVFYIPRAVPDPTVVVAASFLQMLVPVFVIAACLLFYAIVKQTCMRLIVVVLICVTCAVDILLVFSVSHVVAFPDWSTAQTILSYQKKDPSAKVVIYDKRLYALPFYLNQQVPLVSHWSTMSVAHLSDSWQREIAEGFQYLSARPPLLMDLSDWKDTLQQAKKKNQTYIMVTTRHGYKSSQWGVPLYLISESQIDNVAIFTNSKRLVSLIESE